MSEPARKLGPCQDGRHRNPDPNMHGRHTGCATRWCECLCHGEMTPNQAAAVRNLHTALRVANHMLGVGDES